MTKLRQQMLVLKHMPQLDSLRAFSVLAVLAAHFGGPISRVMACNGVDLGAIGVRCFFVLSGFLITSILLKARGESGQSSLAERGRRLGRFYTRRFIRICPLYYMVLLVTYLLALPEVRENIVWHATYLSNFSGYAMGNASHLWSLCVEGQFYIVWPLLVLFSPSRSLRSILACFMVLSVAISSAVDNPLIARTILSFLFLAFGCFLASILWEMDEGGFARNSTVKMFLWGGGALMFCGPLALMLGGKSERFLLMLAGIGQGIFFSWVIAKTAGGSHGVVGRVFDSRVLRYLGKISYGIYVYHFFVPKLVIWGLSEIGFVAPVLVRSTLYITVTFIISALSWHLFEKPLCALKARFE